MLNAQDLRSSCALLRGPADWTSQRPLGRICCVWPKKDAMNTRRRNPIFGRHVWLVFSLLVGCKSQSTTPDLGGLSWLRTASGAYSWAFFAEPSTGTFTKLAVWEADTASACEKQKAGMLGKIDGFWVLLVTLGEASPGVYEIHPNMEPSDGGQVAKAELVFVENTKRKIVLPARSGTINVTSMASTLAEWNDGKEMRVDGNIVLATTVYREIECFGGQSPGAPAITECICEDQDTHETEKCTIALGRTECCSDFAGGANAARFTVAAQPCPEMCVYSDPALGKHCSELGMVSPP